MSVNGEFFFFFFPKNQGLGWGYAIKFRLHIDLINTLCVCLNVLFPRWCIAPTIYIVSHFTFIYDSSKGHPYHSIRVGVNRWLWWWGQDMWLCIQSLTHTLLISLTNGDVHKWCHQGVLQRFECVGI